MPRRVRSATLRVVRQPTSAVRQVGALVTTPLQRFKKALETMRAHKFTSVGSFVMKYKFVYFFGKSKNSPDSVRI